MSANTPPATDLCRLRPSLHRQAGEMLARAFFDDPLSIYLSPDEQRRARVLPWLYECIVRYGAMYGATFGGELLVTPNGLDGLAVWLPPRPTHVPVSRRLRAALVLFRTGLPFAPLKFGFDSIGRFMAANTVEHLRAKLAPEPHWYLWVIGVEPEHQGRGLGSSLIGPMLTRADAERKPCYLETHKEPNVRFYQKHGFDVVHSGYVPRDGPAYWCLKRPARR